LPAPDAPESVHLCDWPSADSALIDERLMQETDAVMKVVRLGRAARNAAGAKVRQPLAALYLRPGSDVERYAVVRNERLVLDELNVKTLRLLDSPAEEAEVDEAFVEEMGTAAAVDTRITDELMREGLARDLVRKIQTLRKEAGFNVDDHITIEYQAEGALEQAIAEYSDYVMQETLAESLRKAEGGLATVRIGSEQAGLRVARV
jgi:isoleucyl-tRNA synthetase